MKISPLLLAICLAACAAPSGSSETGAAPEPAASTTSPAPDADAPSSVEAVTTATEAAATEDATMSGAAATPAPASPTPEPGRIAVGRPPKPEPAPAPVGSPPRVCDADSGCFVYFRETRCNYSQPIAIPVAQRRNAPRLYPSSTANEVVGCAMPDLDDEKRARARWTASCSPAGACELNDAGRGAKGPGGR